MLWRLSSELPRGLSTAFRRLWPCKCGWARGQPQTIRIGLDGLADLPSPSNLALPACFRIGKPKKIQLKSSPNVFASIISTPDKSMPEVDSG
ncbi:hypothetical protein PCANC_11895 [Puccinia coronata f. sp. avenae]|uniref:Uncharacterized protein n=1 Tax=Puccinia coronata f. sp. avenae TaxID=200324 RepID=A0A2N5V604_9BASI|nr:hypothetical protein PCANC_11895 [Puccinia coronata f. sp. avenae]